MGHLPRGILPLLLLLQAGPLAATSPAGPLDVGRFLALVRKNHPGSRIATSRMEAAAAQRLEARLLSDPTIEIGIGRGRAISGSERAERNERTFSIHQSLPWPASFAAGIRAADLDALSLEARGRQASWQLEAEAREAFDRLLAARETVSILRSATDDARSLLDLVSRRVEIGEAREADRVRARVDWLRQRLALANAEREMASFEKSVRALAIEPLPDPLVLQGMLPESEIGIGADQVHERLLAANPDVVAARAEAGRDRERLFAARWSRVPDLELSLFDDRELDRKATGFALGFRIPLWNASRGAVAKAEAQASTARGEADRLELSARIDLDDRIRGVENASKRARAIRDEILPAAVESHRIARLLFEEGETSLLDLLDARRTVRETEREDIDSRLDYAVALTQLIRLVGPEAVLPNEPSDRSREP